MHSTPQHTPLLYILFFCFFFVPLHKQQMSFLVSYAQVYVPYQRLLSTEHVFCSLEFDLARFLIAAHPSIIRTQPIKWLFYLTYIDFQHAREQHNWSFFYNYYHLKDVFPDPESIDGAFSIQQYFADLLWLHNRQPNLTYLVTMFDDFKTMDIHAFQQQYDYPVGLCETHLHQAATAA